MKLKSVTNKTKTSDLSNEPYQVVIRPEMMPHMLRLTYSKKISGRLIQIEEISDKEEVITCCKFVGKLATGTGCSHLKLIRQDYSTLKVSDWILTDLYVDEYYMYH